MSVLSAVAAAAGASGEKLYVEDVFSTYLYTGTGASQTINNGIDLATKGGLVWLKRRDISGNNLLYNTVSGVGNYLIANSTNATGTYDPATYDIQTFNTTGFTIGQSWNSVNNFGNTFTSWTFRKQKKFFDVVTWTGNGSSARSITHNLGSTPGMVIVKRTDSTGDWYVGALTSAGTYEVQLRLNTTDGSAGGYDAVGNGWVSSTQFIPEYLCGISAASVNTNGATYVAYLFASDAGGFGLSGTDSIIKCGSYTGNASTNPSITLGWEPQFVLIKNISSSSDYKGWAIFDNMRGVVTNGKDPILYANRNWIEDYNINVGTFKTNYIDFNSTGFTTTAGSDPTGTSVENYIYMAIRRGPMKVPTDATKVFAPVAYTGTNSARSLTTGFPVDTEIVSNTDGGFQTGMFFDKIRGPGIFLTTNANYEDQDYSSGLTSQFDSMTTVKRTSNYFNTNSATYVSWNLKRAPGFFDVVCYTGDGDVNRQIPHNLGVVPRMAILKQRSTTGDWYVAHTDASSDWGGGPSLNNTAGTYWSGGIFMSTPPTSTYFTRGQNSTNVRYVVYLFATCPGVSKVGGYTGTGTTNQINCGFTNGARFVLIKRTDSTGGWYTWDSARGIIAGNDPYLRLNSPTAEVTNTDYIDPYSPGFELSSTAPADINANGGTYIFLAIA